MSGRFRTSATHCRTIIRRRVRRYSHLSIILMRTSRIRPQYKLLGEKNGSNSWNNHLIPLFLITGTRAIIERSLRKSLWTIGRRAHCPTMNFCNTYGLRWNNGLRRGTTVAVGSISQNGGVEIVVVVASVASSKKIANRYSSTSIIIYRN